MQTLEQAVLEEIESNVEGMNRDEAQYWVENDAICISGAVSGLIYYHDTMKFFDKHEDEILDLAKDYDFNVDVREEGTTGFKNQMSWFAFEVLKDGVFDNNIDDLFPEDEEEAA